jgi:hypothetical protein
MKKEGEPSNLQRSTTRRYGRRGDTIDIDDDRYDIPTFLRKQQTNLLKRGWAKALSRHPSTLHLKTA